MARRLELGSAKYNVTGLTVERLGRSTAVHIQCSTPLGYRASSPESGVIEVKIYGAEVNTSRVAWQSRRGLVTSARSRQYSDNAVVSIKVDELVGHFRTYTSGGGTEIVLVLEEEQVGIGREITVVVETGCSGLHNCVVPNATAIGRTVHGRCRNVFPRLAKRRTRRVNYLPGLRIVERNENRSRPRRHRRR